MRRLRRPGGLLVLLGLLVMAPVVQANYEPLGSGATRITFDKGFLALLQQNGVKLAAVAPATLKGGVVAFPVSGGKFDPTSAKGTVEHEGMLVFRAGRRKVPLRALQLKTTQRRSPLSVKAGGGQLKLADAAKLVVGREGFGDRVKVSDLTLSAKVAERLGKKLHLHDVFREGQPLGTTLTKARPVTIAVLGKNKASLVLDPGIVAKLQGLFVAVNPIFPAEHIGASFTLPIFGGTIAPDASSGTIETSGALEALQLGGGQVFWQQSSFDLAVHAALPEVNVQPSPPYAGKVGQLPVASLGTGAIASNPKARTVTIAGASLAMQALTAATFNEVFAKPQGKDNVFQAGEPLGTLSFTAQGQ
jgi:hypothetical protein